MATTSHIFIQIYYTELIQFENKYIQSIIVADFIDSRQDDYYFTFSSKQLM